MSILYMNLKLAIVLWQQDGILNLYRLQMPSRSDFSNQII